MATFLKQADIYKQIGLEDFSTSDQVRSAYKKLALIHHPDKGGDPEKMKVLNSIYDTLSKHKAEYDAWLKSVKMPDLSNAFAGFYQNSQQAAAQQSATVWAFHNNRMWGL